MWIGNRQLPDIGIIPALIVLPGAFALGAVVFIAPPWSYALQALVPLAVVVLQQLRIASFGGTRYRDKDGRIETYALIKIDWYKLAFPILLLCAFFVWLVGIMVALVLVSSH